MTALFADLARSTAIGEKARSGSRARHGRAVLRARHARDRGARRDRREVQRRRGDGRFRHADWPTRTIPNGQCARRSRSGRRCAIADAQERTGSTAGADRHRVGRGRGGRSVRRRDDGHGRRDEHRGAARAAGRAGRDRRSAPALASRCATWSRPSRWASSACAATSAAVAGWRVTGIAAEVGRPRGVPGLEAPLTGRDEELAAAARCGTPRKAGEQGRALHDPGRARRWQEPAGP